MGVPSARAAFVLAGSAPRGPGSEACGAGPGQREKRVIPHPTCPQLTVGVCRRDEAAALVLPSLGAASPTRCGRCRPVSGFSDESCVCGSDAGPPWWALGSHGGEDPSCRCSRRFIRRASCLSSSSASHCSRCFESSEPRWPPSRPPDPSCCPALPTRRRRVWSRERARLWLLGDPTPRHGFQSQQLLFKVSRWPIFMFVCDHDSLSVDSYGKGRGLTQCFLRSFCFGATGELESSCSTRTPSWASPPAGFNRLLAFGADHVVCAGQ